MIITVPLFIWAHRERGREEKISVLDGEMYLERDGVKYKFTEIYAGELLIDRVWRTPDGQKTLRKCRVA